MTEPIPKIKTKNHALLQLQEQMNQQISSTNQTRLRSFRLAPQVEAHTFEDAIGSSCNKSRYTISKLSYPIGSQCQRFRFIVPKSDLGDAQNIWASLTVPILKLRKTPTS